MEYLPEVMKSDLLHMRCVVRNVSMDVAAAEIGVSKTTIAKVEQGSMLDVRTFAKLCAWLHTRPSKYFKT
jgi:transcriptional regulator with XRE-family HTH domain